MKKTSKILLVLGVLLISTTLVSAAVITYFGEAKVKLDVKQSVVISADGMNWNNWNQPLGEVVLNDVVNCKDYTIKRWIWDRSCSDATVSFKDVCTIGDSVGITKNHYVFGDSQTIQLVQKVVDFDQSPWLPATKGIEATLTFNTCGTMFDWNIESEDALSGYTLIYYANYPDYWTEGPVTVLGTSGTYDGPTMPFANDENALRSINEQPIGENYEHDFGAKFWLVPTDALIAVQDGWDVDWTQAGNFLFETDLGFYMDCDNMSPVYLPNVYPIFDTTTLKAETEYCWISTYHVDFNIMPGIYAFSTFVHAAEVAI
jgi:hypothetical protein